MCRAAENHSRNPNGVILEEREREALRVVAENVAGYLTPVRMRQGETGCGSIRVATGSPDARSIGYGMGFCGSSRSRMAFNAWL